MVIIFKFKRSVRVSYLGQGVIYFCSLARGKPKLSGFLGDGIVKTIDESLYEASGGFGEYGYRALRAFVVEGKSAAWVVSRYPISQSSLYRMVRLYYEAVWKRTK